MSPVPDLKKAFGKMTLTINFGFEIPIEVDGVDMQILDPRATLRDGDGYDQAARGLGDRFGRNFTQFITYVDESVRAAAPPGAFGA